MQFPTLHTERLILRPWRDDDLESFAALNADPAVMEFFPSAARGAPTGCFVFLGRRDPTATFRGMLARNTGPD